jgi:hypothetical protein
MKPIHRIGLLLVFALFILFVPTAQAQDSAPCDRSNMKIGCVLTELDGVQVHYNGTDFSAYVGEGPTGYQWQCVELMRRYYNQVYNYPTSWGTPFVKQVAWGAYQFFDEDFHPSRMQSYANGSPTKPQKGDILVFDATRNNSAGHVAIVKSVSNNRVIFVQQNYLDLGEDSLPIDSRNRINSEGRYGDVRGWLRDAPTPPPPAPLVLVQQDTLKLVIPFWAKFIVASKGRFELKLDNKIILTGSSDQVTPWTFIGLGQHPLQLYAERKDSQFYYSWWPVEPVLGNENVPTAPTPTPQIQQPTASPASVSPSVGGCANTNIDNFLSCMRSPLSGLGATFIQAGRRYNVDPRFVVAISNAESSLGENGDCAKQRYNAWGYGGGWPSCWSFSSWQDGIWQVTLDIGEYYFKRYHQTTIQSFVSNCGSHCYCASGCSNWVKNVGDAYEAMGGNRNATDLSFAVYSGDGGTPVPTTPAPMPTTLVPPPIAGKPSLASPTNGSNIGQSTTVILFWSPSAGAVQYKVEVWGGPYNLMTPCNWQNGTSCSIGQMWPGTVSWHVKSRNAIGQESDWSDTWSFTVQQATPIPTTPAPQPTTPIPPSANSPSLASPSNGANMPQSTNVILSWNQSLNAYQYKVEVWGGPYSLMTPCNWQSRTTCTIGQMWPGTMSWHVKARNASGQETNWSDTWSFTIQQPTPIPTTPALPPSAGKPSLSSPGNGTSMAQSTNVVLAWNSSANAYQYKVEVWGGPYSLMTPCNWQSGTTCTIGQMWPGTMSWHVKARNSSGQESDWSDTWSFTIQQPPPPNASKPSLASPGNGANMAQSTDVTLVWNSASNATQYKVELWGGPYSLMTPCNWQSGTSCHIGQMWPGTMLWHVKARNSGGQESDWSDTWSFTIQNAPSPTSTPLPSGNRPTLSSPSNGGSLPKSTDVTLRWNSLSGYTQYKVELWGGPYSLMTPCNWQSGTSCHIGQMWPGTMRWHVKARDASGRETDWSDEWSFIIQN